MRNWNSADHSPFLPPRPHGLLLTRLWLCPNLCPHIAVAEENNCINIFFFNLLISKECHIKAEKESDTTHKTSWKAVADLLYLLVWRRSCSSKFWWLAIDETNWSDGPQVHLGSNLCDTVSVLNILSTLLCQQQRIKY